MKLRRNSILVLSLCLLVTTSVLSQTRNNSPYSIYGIGTINDYSNPISFSMGGVGIAFQDQASINLTNPASFASLRENSFVFDAGLVMNSSKLSSTDISEKASYATLNHLLFGFQIIKNWKTSFGIIPFSDVGYNINDYESIDGVADINHIYNGNGGVTKAYWANAFNITKKLSIGIEAGLFFGEIERGHLFLIEETDNIFHTKQNNISNYNDFYFKTGIQYTTSLNDNLGMTIGVIYSGNTNVKTTLLSTTQLVRKPVDGITSVIDTFDETTTIGKTVIPGVLGFGIMLKNKENLKLGFDFEKQFWSKFKAFDEDGSFKNSTRLALGAEFIPEKNSVFSYVKRIRYRLGLRYEKTPLYVNNTQLNEIGISFGVGLPLRRSLSSINIGMEIGQLGKTSNNLVKDTFVKFKLGISMHQKWFEQRKYY